ncbi:glycosyltransferase family 2 protein [Ramlibacter sp. AW1]|uniref:Glycosyltransferase family 2 protein n=1 Tax=Ramlibacter aurantiacus TaxID=2801330 RepID=A0A937D7Q8_9BURK|nr:glycosyltransferase family 2 protein [Ramlibacter aurantiacus]MBL0421206.1 glycosyltransferase family 2 protein [Ramlibacter aurantiacus]
MKTVVLMSTYNGARFIREQVASILSQLPSNGLLLVRDDGSRDDTVDAIEAFADPRIVIERGANIGFGASFLTLLCQAPDDADLVMFSDQDDVWLPGKIARAGEYLGTCGDTPALYCTAQRLVDESLAVLGTSPPWPRGPSMASAVAENIVTGCTAALNRSALAFLKKGGIPREVRFHDWWMYLAISTVGRVLVDDEPTILYRQHGRNTIGRGAGWWGRHVQIVRFLIRNDWVGMLLGQVHALWRCYGPQLAPSQRQLIERYFYFQEGRAHFRWRLVFSLQRWRQSAGQELMFRGLLMLHRLGWRPEPRQPAC